MHSCLLEATNNAPVGTTIGGHPFPFLMQRIASFAGTWIIRRRQKIMPMHGTQSVQCQGTLRSLQDTRPQIAFTFLHHNIAPHLATVISCDWYYRTSQSNVIYASLPQFQRTLCMSASPRDCIRPALRYRSTISVTVS